MFYTKHYISLLLLIYLFTYLLIYLFTYLLIYLFSFDVLMFYTKNYISLIILSNVDVLYKELYFIDYFM